MSRKLWTSAVLLAAVAGTGAFTPVYSTAQTTSPAAAPTTTPTRPPAFDAASVLTDGNAPSAQRDEAARRLLSRHTEESRKLLLQVLVDPNANGQGAVARALAEDTQPDPSFIDPLFPLLQNRELAAYAGRALSGYKNVPEVLTRLISLATIRPSASEWTRTAAIRAIGTMSEKRAAATLMDLLTNSPDDSAKIHSTTAEALVNLTGLDQNGQDAAKWRKWWESAQNQSDADFRQSIQMRKDVRLDRLSARYTGLLGELSAQLREEYYATAAKDREALALKLLNSPEPDIRKISAEIVRESFQSDGNITDAEKERLRDMVGDSTPAVRGAAAQTLSKINYAGAIDALLAQLTTEPDPTVRAAIATALGPIHNLKAVDPLLDLLNDSSLPTATAAARSLVELAKNGGLTKDDELKRKTALKLKETIIRTLKIPGAEELRSACVEVLAPLKQLDVIQDLLDLKLLDSGKEQSWSVRTYMLQALGELNDKRWAERIAHALDDPSANVRLQAIVSLGTNPSAAEWAGRVGSMMDPTGEREPSVRDAAWTFMLSVFPQLKAQQLQGWAENLKADPAKQVLVLQALADKQQRAGQLTDLAVTRGSIGQAYFALKQYGDAAASFKAALELYNNTPGAMRDLLETNYMKSLLQGGKYADAVAFAADRIRADQTEQSTMGPILVHYIDELLASGRTEDVAAARQLLDLARKMSPPLGDKYQRDLDSSEAALKQHP